MPLEELEALMLEIESTPDNRERQKLFGLIQPVVDLHREALQRVVEIVRESGGEHVLEKFAADDLLGDLLRGYELMPTQDIQTRVLVALDEARPLLHSHGGDVELVEMRGRIAILQLTGSCQGCASSLITLKRGVEATLFRLVPDLRGVEVSGITTPALPPGAKWLPLVYWTDLHDGEWLKVNLFEDELLVCTFDQRPFAFKNRCPEGGESLETAEFHELHLMCADHGKRFDLRTGACANDPTLHLDVLPVMVDDAVIKVAI